MVRFDAEHKAVHYPTDRRFRIWIPSILMGIGIAILSVIAAAWIEVAVESVGFAAWSAASLAALTKLFN